jgi:Ca2+/Na+ antiporter
MKDFDALKDIWSNQAALSRVNSEDVLKRVKQSGNDLSNKLRFEVFAMLAAIIILSYVLLTVSFKMWTSHAGIFIFIACCVYILLTQYTDYRKMSDSARLLNVPGDYIIHLKTYKHHRYLLNTRKYRIYTVFFSAGLLLLFVEIFFVAELWITILGVLFAISWFLFC